MDWVNEEPRSLYNGRRAWNTTAMPRGGGASTYSVYYLCPTKDYRTGMNDMGIECQLFAVDGRTARRLIANPRSAGPTLMRSSGANGCNIHKAWHAIHFVLTGQAQGGTEPHCLLLDGGTLLGTPSDGYDPPRVFSPEQVRDFDSVLQPISRLSLLRQRFDHAAMVDAEIYSMNGGENNEAEDLEFTAEFFKILRRFIHEAAGKGDGVIITIG